MRPGDLAEILGIAAPGRPEDLAAAIWSAGDLAGCAAMAGCCGRDLERPRSGGRRIWPEALRPISAACGLRAAYCGGRKRKARRGGRACWVAYCGRCLPGERLAEGGEERHGGEGGEQRERAEDDLGGLHFATPFLRAALAALASARSAAASAQPARSGK